MYSLMIFGGLGLSISAALEAQHYAVQTYGMVDGLPDPYVTSIGEGLDGRIWVATRLGLCHFDGIEWQPEDAVRSNHLAMGWFGESPQPWLLSSDWRTYKVHRPVGNTWVDHSFEALSGMPSAGAVSTDPRQSQAAFALAASKHLFLWFDNQWLDVDLALLGEDAFVYSILFYQGAWLLGTEEGLIRVSSDGHRIDRVVGPEKPVLALTLGLTNTEFWAVGEDWIGRSHDGQFEVLDAEFGAGPPQFGRTLAIADGVGGLFFGNKSRVWRFHLGYGIESLGRANGLLSEGVTAFHRDRQGTVWVGQEVGLSRVVSLRFASYRQAHGLASDAVTVVRSLRDGSILLGHPSGLTRIRESHRFERFDLPIPRRQLRVWDAAEDRAGHLWLAINQAGWARVSSELELLEVYGLEEPTGFAQAVLVDGHNQVWFGDNIGLYRLVGNRREPVPLPFWDDQEGIRRLIPAQDGVGFWIATRASGLMRYRGDGDVEVFQASPRDSQYNMVWDVLEDGDETLLATRSGSARLVGRQIEALPIPSLVEEPVFFVDRDRQDQLWLGTRDGVVLFDGHKGRRLSVFDGLAGQETNRAAFMVDRRGAVWVGTNRGVSVYRHDFDATLPPPEVEWVSLRVGARSYPLDAPVDLGVRPETVSFLFRAVTATPRGRLLVSTWLEGQEETWGEPFVLKSREIRYTHLPPGQYRLRLKVKGQSGVWSRPVTTAMIRIARPVWRQSWFLGGLTVLLLGLVTWGHRSLAQRRYSRQLEEELARRWRALETSEARYRRVLTSIADGVLILDSERRITLLNPAAAVLLGASESDLSGRLIGDVLRFDRVSVKGAELDEMEFDLDSWLGSCLAGQVENLAEIRLKETREREAFAGEWRFLNLVASPIERPRGQINGAVITVQDVTEKRREEEQRARIDRLEAVGLLAGGIAHDFNNLLTVVLGNLDLIAMASDNTPSRALADAEEALEQAQSLTHQLLTFSRGGSPIRRTVALDELIEKAIQLTLSGSNVCCARDYAVAPAWAAVDPGQCHQVFTNLLINAVEAMPEGGIVQIGIERTRMPSEMGCGECLCVRIADNGPGIEPEVLEHIFDPYFSTKGRGSGLGLSTVFSIVRRHEGWLTVESEVGQGLVFRIFLAESTANPTDEILKVATNSVTGGRILVMDDEPAVRRVTEAILCHHGFRVNTASDGDEAIATYCQSLGDGHPFDLVIMDLTVPGGMGGREAFAALIDIHPEVRGIVASGYANDPVMSQYREHGFRAVLPKPFQARELLHTVQEVLANDPGTH